MSSNTNPTSEQTILSQLQQLGNDLLNNEEIIGANNDPNYWSANTPDVSQEYAEACQNAQIQTAQIKSLESELEKLTPGISSYLQGFNESIELNGGVSEWESLWSQCSYTNDNDAAETALFGPDWVQTSGPTTSLNLANSYFTNALSEELNCLNESTTIKNDGANGTSESALAALGLKLRGMEGAVMTSVNNFYQLVSQDFQGEVTISDQDEVEASQTQGTLGQDLGFDTSCQQEQVAACQAQKMQQYLSKILQSVAPLRSASINTIEVALAQVQKIFQKIETICSSGKLTPGDVKKVLALMGIALNIVASVESTIAQILNKLQQFVTQGNIQGSQLNLQRSSADTQAQDNIQANASKVQAVMSIIQQYVMPVLTAVMSLMAFTGGLVVGLLVVGLTLLGGVHVRDGQSVIGLATQALAQKMGSAGAESLMCGLQMALFVGGIRFAAPAIEQMISEEVNAMVDESFAAVDDEEVEMQEVDPNTGVPAQSNAIVDKQALEKAKSLARNASQLLLKQKNADQRLAILLGRKLGIQALAKTEMEQVASLVKASMDQSLVSSSLSEEDQAKRLVAKVLKVSESKIVNPSEDAGMLAQAKKAVGSYGGAAVVSLSDENLMNTIVQSIAKHYTDNKLVLGIMQEVVQSFEQIFVMLPALLAAMPEVASTDVAKGPLAVIIQLASRGTNVIQGTSGVVQSALGIEQGSMYIAQGKTQARLIESGSVKAVLEVISEQLSQQGRQTTNALVQDFMRDVKGLMQLYRSIGHSNDKGAQVLSNSPV